MARDDGFTLIEMMVSMTIMLIVVGGALSAFQNALLINDSAAQMADANQNLRAGTNQLIKDIMQAGRIIGPEGIPVPTGTGASAIVRPSPPGTTLTFSLDSTDPEAPTTNLPDISTGYHLGPLVNGIRTDMITLLTVDPFMPTIDVPTGGTIDSTGAFVTLPSTSVWLTGDTTNDTPAIQVGDLVFFKNTNGTALQTVTRITSTGIYFEAGDVFNFNQRSAPAGTIVQIKGTGASFPPTTLFRLLMITYYVDNVTTPGAPRLTRQVNNFPAQALAGVVEDLDFTYDLVDGVNNPTEITSLPYTDTTSGATYGPNQIRKVNIHVGVRSEGLSRPIENYVRSHISTAVDVRSLASVDRYVTQ